MTAETGRQQNGKSRSCHSIPNFLSEMLSRSIAIRRLFPSGRIVISARKCLSSSSNNEGIVQSSIITQQGNEIQELPIVFRKFSSNLDGVDDRKNAYEDAKHLINFRTEDIILLIEDCKTIRTVLFVVNAFKESQMPVEVAIHALHKILKVGGSVDLRNLEDSSDLFNSIVENIARNAGSSHILEMLANIKKNSMDLSKTVRVFNNELLLRNTDSTLSIIEVCECIEVMDTSKSADRFWIGIADNTDKITADNIVFVFRILPKIKVSRKLISSILDKRIPEIWYDLKPDVVIESMECLKQCNLPLHSVLQCYARWANTNGHLLKENQLCQLLKQFRSLEFTNGELEKSLERLMKAKAANINDQDLIEELLNYSIHFRIRNGHILNGCCEHFISRSGQYHPKVLKTLLEALGQFNFAPVNRVKFWINVEDYIRKNFSKIDPSDVISMFLNCCYLEIYPLNFVSSIFNPHFLDNLYSSVEDHKIPHLRSLLKLLDATLTLEASNYNGPLLPKDHSAKSLWTDGRIRRMLNSIRPYMERLAGGSDRMSYSVIIGKLPTNNMYIIDILIHPPGLTKFFQYSVFKDKNVNIAILILLPEHFDHKGEHLCGSQEMRIRHFRRLGFKVVTFKYSEVAKRLLLPNQLEEYLSERIKHALPALDFKV